MKIFKRNKQENSTTNKMYEVHYTVCNSKGYIGYRVDIMDQHELDMIRADWMYYDVEEVWELS